MKKIKYIYFIAIFFGIISIHTVSAHVVVKPNQVAIQGTSTMMHSITKPTNDLSSPPPLNQTTSDKLTLMISLLALTISVCALIITQKKKKLS